MKLKGTIIFLFISLLSNSQQYININQTINNTNVFHNDYSVGLSIISSEISAFRNVWESKKRIEEARLKAQAQLSIIKNNYSNSEKYPETIIDGWHSIMATDNFSYCSPAKVFIKNNEIKEFVISNWNKMSYPFKILSSIKKGKALITLDINGNTDTLELYFINDLEKPTIVEAPLNSGFICFWSDSSKAKSTKIWVEKKYYGELSERFKIQPECSVKGTITIEVKPGTYHYKAAGSGTISWEGDIEARENTCLSYLLNKENKK